MKLLNSDHKSEKKPSVRLFEKLINRLVCEDTTTILLFRWNTEYRESGI